MRVDDMTRAATGKSSNRQNVEDALTKCIPSMVTVVPPRVGPSNGAICCAAALRSYRNATLCKYTASAFMMETLTSPEAGYRGVTQLIWLIESWYAGTFAACPNLHQRSLLM